MSGGKIADEFDGVSEHAGFPNAATDQSLTSLDIAKLLVKNPASTFFMRIEGENGEKFGIFSGDIIVIDRALIPTNTDLVIWWGNDSFALGRPKQVPKNLTIWGVVTRIIHQLRAFNEK